MITLNQNLQDAILFAMLDDAKIPHDQARYYSSRIGPNLANWVRNYFIWFTKGHMDTIKNKETRKEFEFFVKMIERGRKENDYHT